MYLETNVPQRVQYITQGAGVDLRRTLTLGPDLACGL